MPSFILHLRKALADHIMTFTGFRQGQRVKSLKTPYTPEFEGIIESVVVPRAGKRFVVLRDEGGHCHHRWFHEIEATERNEGERADHDLLSDR